MSRKAQKVCREFHRTVLLLLILVAGTACSTAPPQSSNMVPVLPAPSQTEPTRSVRVVALVEPGQGSTIAATGGFVHFTTGAYEPPDWARVTDTMFRDS